MAFEKSRNAAIALANCTTVVPFLVVFASLVASNPGGAPKFAVHEGNRPPLRDITSNDFDAVLTEKVELAVVLFVNADCPKCVELRQNLTAASYQLDALNPPPLVVVANMEGSNEAALKYGVAVYPTLKLFRRGKEIFRKWRGDTSALGLTERIVALSQPVSVEVRTVDEAQGFVPSPDGGNEGTVVMGFFKSVDMDLEQLLEAADQLRDITWLRFIHAHTDAVMKEYGHRHTFAVFNGDRTLLGLPNPAVWDPTAAFNSEDALKFIAANGIPLVGVLNEDTQLLYNRNTKTKVKLYVDTAHPSTVHYYTTRLRRIAFKYPHLVFVLAGKEFHEEATALQFTAEQIREGYAAAVWAQKPGIATKWRVEMGRGGKFSLDGMDHWLSEFDENKTATHLKSSVEPENNPKPGEGKVVEVTARTFRQLVMDAPYTVLLTVHAPWCGHCKKFLPLLPKIAERLKDRHDILIAHIDATANELPHGYHVQGYPTVFLSTPRFRHTPEIHSGPRTVDDLVRFIEDRIRQANE